MTHPLNPAERAAKLLAFHPSAYNYTQTKTPAKPVPVASNRFKTA